MRGTIDRMSHRLFPRTGLAFAAAAVVAATVAAGVVATVGAALVPQGAASASDTPMEPPVATVIPANDKEKKAILDGVAEAAQAKTTDALVKALTDMQTRKHEEFVPVIRANVEAADPVVQAAAIRAAGAHELRDLEKSVRKTLRAKPKKSASGELPGAVAVACIDYLDRLDIAGEEEAVVTDHLRVLFSDERRLKASWASDMLRAAIHYLGRRKFKPAVPFIIEEMIDRPVPKDPNDPKNPPATYWEARTKLWQDYESWGRWMLKETTGQTFRSVREWQAWLKTQDKKAYK